MELNEFKDRLFDLINESSDLPVSDIAVNDRENTISNQVLPLLLIKIILKILCL